MALGHYSWTVDTNRPATLDEAALPLTPETEQTLLENRQRFLSFLERRLGNRAVAEELLQSAFVRTIESGAAPGDGEGAITWFYRLLRNALIDHFRKQTADARAGERLSREPAEQGLDQELHQTVCACFKGLLPMLKPEYAEMVRRVDLDERPVTEVAAELGVTSNNASVRLHRARQALKRQLERACGACATHGCLDCTCANHRKTQPE